MRPLAVASLAALTLVCSGQEPARQAEAPAAAGRRMDFAGITKIESTVEQKLKTVSPSDPIDLLGACTGVYLQGYGLVFTVPISLISSPPIFGPFTGNYTPQKAEGVRKRKLANYPLVKKAASELLTQAAKASPDIAPGEKIALAIRFFYLDYEDTTGLPKELVASADRDSALAGNVALEAR